MQQLFTNLFLVHFQTKDSDTHVYTHAWLSQDGKRNAQKTTFKPVSL